MRKEARPSAVWSIGCALWRCLRAWCSLCELRCMSGNAVWPGAVPEVCFDESVDAELLPQAECCRGCSPRVGARATLRPVNVQCRHASGPPLCGHPPRWSRRSRWSSRTPTWQRRSLRLRPPHWNGSDWSAATDLDAELNRSRHGIRPISAKGARTAQPSAPPGPPRPGSPWPPGPPCPPWPPGPPSGPPGPPPMPALRAEAVAVVEPPDVVETV